MVGFVTFVLGLLAELISFNRELVELILERVRRLELVRDEQAVKDDRSSGP